MIEDLLQVKKLSVSFSTQKVVQDISLNIEKGETLAIVGESGSGKSVTALSILQLLPKTAKESGTIHLLKEEKYIALQNLSTNSLQHIRGNRIAMIFQEPMTSLNPVKTCGSQVAEALILHKKLNKRQADKEVTNLFREVQLPHPETIGNRYPHELSGGQKQRVMIAMAMSCKPDLLICDEPTTALDVLVQKEILLLIKKLQEKKEMSVLFISHDINLVAEIADRIAVFYQGKLLEVNTTKEILHSPKELYTKALLACRPALYGQGEKLPVVSDFLEEKNRQQGTPIKIENERISTEKKEILLSVKDLNTWYIAGKNFKGEVKEYNKAVKDISFEIFKGETLGLVGASGCGKTTLGRSIIGLEQPVSGEIFFKGKSLLHQNKKQRNALSHEIQMIFQDPYASLNPALTIGDAIAEPLKVKHIYPDKKIKQTVIEWLGKTGLKPEYYHRYPHEFSGGQRQRIVIARALITHPSFVICDECVSALDISVQAQILNLLNDLKKELNFTTLFISHDLSVIKYLCDRVIVMNNGNIEELGTAEDIYTHPKTEYTKQLLIAALPKFSFK